MRDNTMLDHVRRAVHQHQLIRPGERIVVGVSGGADSLALMHILARLQPTFGFELHIATLDHGWRGEESAADATFVVEQAKALGLRVSAERADMSAVTSNLEAAGRRARFDFFARVAAKVGARTVAVGHHANDQAETVLMRLIRGTGLHGLAGMRWTRALPYHPHLTLIRPLLGVTRAQINAYCMRHGLVPREDPTNADINFMRNRVRREILPTLAELNPNIYASLNQIAETAAVEDDFMTAVVDNHTKAFTTSNDLPQVDRDMFRSWHPAVQRRVLIRLVADINPDTEVGYDHVIEAVQLAVAGEVGAVAEFPGNIQMRVGYDALSLETKTEKLPKVSLAMHPGTSLPVQTNSSINLENGNVMLSNHTPVGWQLLGTIYLPPNAKITLRTRQSGDRITPPGMEGRGKKLARWMIDRKIPKLERDAIPLLLVNDGIAAVLHPVYGTVAHPYHTTSATPSQVFQLIWQPHPNKSKLDSAE
ncbi:MAG: tRNA lysidine(34) synthetase TilS [Chloroflexota bacterium]